MQSHCPYAVNLPECCSGGSAFPLLSAKLIVFKLTDLTKDKMYLLMETGGFKYILYSNRPGYWEADTSCTHYLEAFPVF